MSEAGPGSADAYRSLAAPAEGEFRDRGSRFLAYAAAADDLGAVRELVAGARAAHPQARHACVGAVLDEPETPYTQDDGEPAGTAGAPIAQRIRSAGLRRTGIVVVRYFGGTLLGRAGLINAYGSAAAEALRAARFETRYHREVMTLTLVYPRLSDVMRRIEQTVGAEILERDFTDICRLRVAVPLSQAAAVAALEDHTGDVRVGRAEQHRGEPDR